MRTAAAAAPEAVERDPPPRSPRSPDSSRSTRCWTHPCSPPSVDAEAVPPDFGAATWRRDLSAYAHALAAALAAHPHTVPLLLSRPAVTPRNLRTLDAVVGMLHEAGFPLPRTLDVLYSLTGFVVGHAAAQAGRVDDAGIMTALDEDAYPRLVAAARAAGDDRADTRFTFALNALLSGFEAELAT
ncbi:TetR/AcrR family transcriptional regulator C-terminal domain-containing protein [Streptomyces sp. NPDC085466]|uniref:TetR/AcrR family transcriptional regulator C-terminal domain-containing protein n=1 Tax=Streptomyces sp. NPDC085466 TaxID=3365725 RepID=UPI0037D60F87